MHGSVFPMDTMAGLATLLTGISTTQHTASLGFAGGATSPGTLICVDAHPPQAPMDVTLSRRCAPTSFSVLLCHASKSLNGIASRSPEL